MIKRIVLVPVAMIAVAAFAPAIASAATFNTSATIGIQGTTGDAFGGTVNSSHSACKSARTVTLQRKSPGSSNFANIGSDKSASNGDWSVNTNPVANAQYRAQVATKKISGNTCKAATSPTVTARKTTSTIAISTPLGDGFKGAVASNSSCVSGRQVTLQRKLSGGSFGNLSNDTTDGGGAWAVPTSPVNNAQYKAFVRAKQSGSNSCMATNSPVTTAHNSAVSIVQGGSTNFHGNVNSVTACKSNRTVTLQRSISFPYSNFTSIGADATNANGAWLVPTSVVSGAHYRALTGAKQAGANSCLSDFSNEVAAT